jgi:TRAP-type C4-dicarboxylate transport system permease large subunit
MESTRVLLVSGILLLAIAALLGFVQERYRHSPEKFAQWRVVHAGGSAGAVQLLALAAVWQHFAHSGWATALAWGLIAASWAFFLGPLSRAVDQPLVARWVNMFGAIIALPTYLLLPTLLV